MLSFSYHVFLTALRRGLTAFAQSASSCASTLASCQPRAVLNGPGALVTASVLACAGVSIAVYALAPVWLLPVALVAAWLSACAKGGKAAVVLVLTPLLSFAYALWRLPGPHLDDLSRFVGLEACIVRAVVLEVDNAATPACRHLLLSPREMLFPTRRSLSGKVSVAVFGAPHFLARGETIEITLRVRQAQKASHAWQLDEADFERRRGVYCVASADGKAIKLIGARTTNSDLASALSLWVEEKRLSIVQFHKRHAGEREGTLLASMVLGDRAVKLGADIKQAFQDVGLSHLLAASGLNLTIVTGMVFLIARFFVRSVAVINLACLAAMLTFVLLAGLSPSVLRAALMCAVLLFSRCLYRSGSTEASMAFALVVTLVCDPAAVADVGLQLSYFATAGIIYGIKPASELAQRAGLRLSCKWLVEAGAVVVLAQLSVLALQLSYFWQVGLFFLPANLITAPLVPVISVAGFASSLLVVADPTGFASGFAGSLIDKACYWPLHWMLETVIFLASFPWAKVVSGPPAWQAVAFYYLALAGWLIALNAGCRRRFAFFFLLVAAALLFVRGPQPALTVAIFPGAVVAVDAHGHALGFGACEKAAVKRFLRYAGARPATRLDNEVRFVSQPARCYIVGPRPLALLVMSGRQGGIACGNTLPQCDVVVVLRGLTPADLPEPTAVAAIVKRCQASTLVVDCGPRRALLWRRALQSGVCKVGTLKVVALCGHEAILVSDGTALSTSITPTVE